MINHQSYKKKQKINNVQNRKGIKYLKKMQKITGRQNPILALNQHIAQMDACF
jgi:hypothetical protein